MSTTRSWRAEEARARWRRILDGHERAGDLGPNLHRLLEVVDACGVGCRFVDLGVDHGISSMALAADAIDRRHDVHGIDVRFRHLGFDLRHHPRYTRARADSVTAGKRWNGLPLDLVFIDTLHVSPQVLCELYFWHRHVRVGGFVVVHDTAWPDGAHDLQWSAAVRRAGRRWPTSDHAIAAFYGLEAEFARAKHSGFHVETPEIEVHHHPESHGMTLVRINQVVDLRDRIDDWDAVFADREEIVRTVMDPVTIRFLGIDFARDETDATRGSRVP